MFSPGLIKSIVLTRLVSEVKIGFDLIGQFGLTTLQFIELTQNSKCDSRFLPLPDATC